MRTDKTVRSCGNGAYNENFGIRQFRLVASVAIVCDDNMLGEYTVNYKKHIHRRFCQCWMKWQR